MKKEEANKKLKELEKEFNNKVSELRKIIEQPEDLFGKIKNYSDVCKELNEKEFTLDSLTSLPEYLRIKTLAFLKIKQIEKLFNGDWKPKFDGKQYNYYPYFTGIGLGMVFYGSYDSCDFSYGQVTFYKDKETSNFVGKTFIDIYRELY